MPERTVTCGECGASVVLADGSWDDLQEPALRDWQRKHAREVHDGAELSSVEVDPSPSAG